MRNEPNKEEGSNNDGVNDQRRSALRGGALPVNSRTDAAEDTGAVDWKGGACKAKGECALQWNNLAGK